MSRFDTAAEPRAETGRTERPDRTARVVSAQARGRRPLGLWRLEVLRVTRTRRWLLLILGFPVLGAAGPVVVRYIDAILDLLGADGVTPPENLGASEGMAAYLEVSGQLGMLVALGMTAAALAVDHRPGLAAFYRTRTRRAWELVLPRWTVAAAAVCIANAVATGIVWVELHGLFGSVSDRLILYAALFNMLYLLMALGMVAGAAAFLRRPVAIFGAALMALILLPLPRLWRPMRGWEPSGLGGAGVNLLDGSDTPGDYAAASLVAVLLTAALLGLAVWRIGRREM
ncbi:hypothetical protein LO772_15275 [Yinghuangia sp. ASG 101]|uniref:hypothetical protein n=1 Tax=Yinghuangia sp. ASG 101 TaxID=2896848 RepID=UPI001E422D6A|nr:hypothetical protein [Yinghuangia sp. ASG 101]UGQ14807.1 hypothetical protein LO772_15275 [Yinghuangia sp. ASG 101]